jgi:hypothetical protein
MMQEEGKPTGLCRKASFTEAFPQTGQAVEGRAITGNLVAFRNYPGVILESLRALMYVK